VVKNYQFFLHKTPIFLANYAKKSDETLLDLVRPPQKRRKRGKGRKGKKKKKRRKG